MEKNKHLDLEARMQIEEMLREKKNFTEMGKALGKHPTTIRKEIQIHKIYKKTGANGHNFMPVHTNTVAPKAEYVRSADSCLKAECARPAPYAICFAATLKRRHVQDFPNHLMSVTAVEKKHSAHWRNAYMMPEKLTMTASTY